MNTVIVLCIFAIGSVMFTGCNQRERAQTVEGPEHNIVSNMRGYVVWARTPREIVAKSLPDLREYVLRKPISDEISEVPVIHAISGPDCDGRIIYVADYLFSQRQTHELRTTSINAEEENEVFSRAGSALQSRKIGPYVALSPSHGKAAILADLNDLQLPGMFLRKGRIEVWDIDEKRPLDVTAEAVNEPMSWFPDGKRIAFVNMLPRKQVEESGVDLDLYHQYSSDELIPTVNLLDIQSGKITFYHVGWHPIVSVDGKTVLIRLGLTGQGPWICLDSDTLATRVTKWQGGNQAPIGLASNRVVVFWALPTKGTPVDYTEHNSPLSGPKLKLSIKAAVLDSGEFQTIVQNVDPRLPVSYGMTVMK